MNVKKMLTEKQQAQYNLAKKILDEGIDYKRLINDSQYEKMVDSVTPMLIYRNFRSL